MRETILRWFGATGGFGRAGLGGLRASLCAVAVCAVAGLSRGADVAAPRPASQPASRPATDDAWRQRERQGFLQALAAREAQKMPQKSFEELVGLLKAPVAAKRVMAAMRIGQIEAPPDAARHALAGCLGDENWQVRAASLESLGIIGGGPMLVVSVQPLLRDKEALVRCAAAETLGKLAGGPLVVGLLASALGDKYSAVRSIAARALAGKGKAAAGAAGKLAKLVGSDPAWRVRESAAVALSELGVADTTISSALIKALLADLSPEVRLAAAKAISALGIVRKLTAEQLEKLGKPEDEFCQAVIVEALGDGEPDEAKTNAAIGYLDDKSAFVRAAAVRAVGKIGPPAGAAVRRLMGIAQEGNCREQAEAVRALGRIGPTADGVAMLSELLIEHAQASQKVALALARRVPGQQPRSWPVGGPNLGVEFDRAWSLARPPAGERAAVRLRMRLVEAVSALDPNAGAGSLITAMGDPNSQVANLAETALAKCSIPDPETLKTAVLALGALPERHKPAVAELLSRSGRKAAGMLVQHVLAGADPATFAPLAEKIDPNAMALVVDVLNGKDLLAALDAAHALSYSRRFGKHAAAILAEQLSTGGPAARKQARQDLVRLGPAAVDALLILSRGPHATVRAMAMHTLGRIGRAGGKDAEEGLVYGLKDRDSGVRRAAAVALAAVSENPAPAVPVLAEDLKSAVPQLRLEAAETLGRIGPAAGPEAARALAQCLRDEHWAVRLGAARALARIAPSPASAKGVAEALKAATKDSDADVRRAAEAALAAMAKARR